MSLGTITEQRWNDRHPMASPRTLTWALLAVCSLAALVLLVLRVGAIPTLGALVLATACVVMLIRPELATLLTGLLLYVNFPGILSKQHGMPAAVAGAFILLLGFPLLHALVVRREPLIGDTTARLMLLFVALALLSTFLAVDVGVAMDRLQQYVAEGLLLYWLVVNAVRDLPTLRKLLWAILAAGSLLTVLCLYQDVTGSYSQEFGGLAYRDYDETQDDGTLGPGAGAQNSLRAQGPVDEPNRFAQIMIVLVPLAGWAFRTARSPLTRWAGAAAGVLAVTGVGLTMSRGAFLTLAVIAGMMVFIRWLRPWHVLTAAFALALCVPLVFPTLFARIASIGDARHLFGGASQVQEADGAIRGRTTEMLAALGVFRDHPLLGVGPGQFPRFYFQQYASSADIKFRDIAGPRRAHNLYLELGAEQGIVGLLTFMAIITVVMRGLWRAYRYWRERNAELGDLSVALWLSLLAYLCTGVFLHLAYQRYYWFLLALSGAALHILERKAAAAREEV